MATYSLRASNGQFVSAESGGGGVLIANRNDAHEWEYFQFEDAGDGLVTIRVSNGSFVCAEPSGAVLANRPQASTWEHWRVVDRGNGSVALQSAHGKFLCAEGGGGGAVVANRGSASTWETFARDAPPQVVAGVGTWVSSTPGDGSNL